MSKKNGAARAEHVEDDLSASGDKFNLRVTGEFGEAIRDYCMRNHIPFNQLGAAAVREFISRHPRWPHDPVPLPRGIRLRRRLT